MEKPNQKNPFFLSTSFGKTKGSCSSISSNIWSIICYKPCQWLQLHVWLVSVRDVLRHNASRKKSLSISSQLRNCKLCSCPCFCCCCCCCCCQRGLAIPDYGMVHKWCFAYFELFWPQPSVPRLVLFFSFCTYVLLSKNWSSSITQEEIG